MTIRTPNNSYYVSGASGGQNHTLPFGADRFEDDDLFVYVWNTSTEAWDKKTVTTHYTVSSTQVSFTSSHIPSTRVIVLRKTDVDEDFPKADFVAGASIKAQDLDNNQLQALRGIKELRDQKLSAFPSITEDGTPSNPKMYANLDMNGYKVVNQPAGYITSTDILDGTIVTADVADSAITAAKLASDSVTTAKIAADAVNGSKIADNSIDSEHYVDGSIDTAHIADAQVTTAKIANDAVTADKLANTAVTAGSYTAADITVDAQGRVTAASSGTIGTSEIADDAVTTAKILDTNVTTAKIADNAVTTAKIADAELVELATMGGNTASALADLTQSEVQILDGATVTTAELNILDGVTATATELNQLDGNTLKTTGTDFTSSSQFPAASEIDARITARIDPLGGFEAIADEDSFPATAPPEGTVISIANANNLAVNSSGVGAGTRAGGSDAVVINGFPSGFNSTSLDDGIGLLVIATSTAHTYDFHRVVAKNEDVRQLSSDINDFKARYRIGSSNPTTDLDAGDLFFNTGTSKMLVYNATSSAWEEVQAVGDFFINTLSSSSGTGGGSATFNGTAYRFTLSNAPTYAQQLLVSINGVVQKPNSGTSQPSEGFAIDGGDIILAAAPATGSNAFFITIGSSVGIGTPSDNTISTAKIIDGAVTSAKIADGTIVNADVNASAAIAGTKISPDFGSQNVVTTGTVQATTEFKSTTGNDLRLNAGSANRDVFTQVNGTTLMTVQGSTGNVGIGTTSPAQPLHISSAAPDIRLSDTDGGYVDIDANGANLNLRADQGNSQGSTSINFFVDATERMRIDGSGNVGIGTTSPVSKIDLGSDTGVKLTLLQNNYSLGVESNELRIASNQSTTFYSGGHSGTERMRLDSSGRLLVGTSFEGEASADNLTINDSGNCGMTIRSGTNNFGGIYFSDATTGGGEYDGYIAYNHPTRYMSFATGQAERMRLDISGRLLIGTSSAVSTSMGFIQQGSAGIASASANFLLAKDTTSVSNGASLGAIYFSDSSQDLAAYIDCARDGGTWTSGSSQPTRLTFATTADGASSQTEAMRITSDQYVGIGATSPNYALHVKNASAVVNQLECSGGGTVYTRLGNIDNSHGYMGYESKALAFYASNTGGTASQKLGIWDVDGLKFNNDTAAANALDDYEEGTFSPTVQGNTTAGTATYSAQRGKYTKIGDRVFFEIYVAWGSGTGSGSQLYIYGLPYTVSGTNSTYPATTIGYWDSVSFAANSSPAALCASNSTYVYFYSIPNGGGTATAIGYDSTGSIILSGHYEID